MGLPEEVQAILDCVVEKSVITIGTVVLDRLVYWNPKASGHSSNNWVPSKGAPYQDIDGTRTNPSNTAQVSGREEIKSYRLTDGAVFIANNVPYLLWLTLGSSPQAPAGWDRFAIEEGIIEGAKKMAEDQ